jgi:hypothetical protein
MMWRSQSLGAQTALLLLAKRNVVLGGVLLLAMLFFANGVYILARGRIGPRVTKSPTLGKALRYPSRFVLASLYLAVATGLVLLVWQLGTA